MPPKKASIGRKTNEARGVASSRSRESQEQRERRMETDREHRARSRSNRSAEEREEQNRHDRERMQRNRQRERRMETDRENRSRSRSNRSAEEREEQNRHDRERMQRNHNTNGSSLNTRKNLSRIAFNYRPDEDNSSHTFVQIGRMNVVCEFCRAFKFNKEPPGLCCNNGKVKIESVEEIPDLMRELLSGNTLESKHFLEKIQTYNSLFQMTSFGASHIVHDNFMPTFKVITSHELISCYYDSNMKGLMMINNSNYNQIQGQIYHRVGPLLPNQDADYEFLQIYFIGDTNQEVNRRCEIGSNKRRNIVEKIQNLLHEKNELVHLFKLALERMPSDNHKIVIRSDKTPAGHHPGQFNAPTIDEVAIVIVGDGFNPRDIVLHRRNSNQLQRVSELHRSYDALQYPLLFWTGEDQYDVTLKMINPVDGTLTNKSLSAMNYYAYKFMCREYNFNHILKSRRLFHQYAVDMYAKVESERLNYIRYHQRNLRVEEYIHLRDEINNDGNVEDIGQLIILPSSFTGSPRHMHEYAQDAMCYVRHYQRPDLFITFTCNPQWVEIKEHLFLYQSHLDRHDVTARVFKQNLKALMDFITKHEVYGKVRCFMYSVEWQKRGLPHAHILIWLVEKIRSDEVDNVICAEIPDKITDPVLYDVVTKNMIHGPCGDINPSSLCMVDGKCTKRYPRPLISETVSGNDGYPLYRRRSVEDNGNSANIRVRNRDIEIDNRWIVPYSPLLSKTFKAHINVEYCNSVKSIKYICKYVNKGSDMAMMGVANENSRDEISQYQLGRYISTNEALWRIFSFPIHERHPMVQHLAVHLENGQRVYFTSENARERVDAPSDTTLTAFFKLCQTDFFAKTLLYSEIPQYYTWQQNKTFQRRLRGEKVQGHSGIRKSDALARIYAIHPKNDECFYLRLLLVNVRGPTSFENLRTVDGEICPNYRSACHKLGLLENDSQWHDTMIDASNTCSPYQIRDLFAIIIATCYPADPIDLWNKYRDYMTEDILNEMRRLRSNTELEYTLDMYNEALIKIEDICLMIANKTLEECGLIAPKRSMHDVFEQEIRRERQFDIIVLKEYVKENLPKLNAQQKRAYDDIMDAVENKSGGFYFLDAPGGTGKTFLMSLLLAKIRSQNKIALALASSGIAATLLDGGRTAHSALKLPLNVHMIEYPTCGITKRSGMGNVLQQCEIIIWDECTMAYKKSLQALETTMRDIRKTNNLFGGALILIAGDFRQTLPVIPRSTPADELNACLKLSPLWRHVKVLRLTTNVRIQLQNDPSAAEFSKQLLDIGNGTMPVDASTGMITFPENFCRITKDKDELIQSVFPNIIRNYMNHVWLSERAILAGTNKDVTELNWTIQSKIPGDVVSYKSIDTVTNDDDVVHYTTEFLNSLDVPGLPPHNLRLKIGVPIISLRNISQPKLCNGTRLAVKKLMPNVIEATILKGKFKGENVLIPRIPLIPTDMPFSFKRLQFPIRLAFVITINKSQGQSMEICGINLEYPVFSHGQLYVACSRVGKPQVLYIYAKDSQTKNIVYRRALN